MVFCVAIIKDVEKIIEKKTTMKVSIRLLSLTTGASFGDIDLVCVSEACRFHPGDPFFHDAYKVRIVLNLW